MTYINEHSMTSAYCQATTGAEFDAFDANLMSYELDISMIRQIGTTRVSNWTCWVFISFTPFYFYQ